MSHELSTDFRPYNLSYSIVGFDNNLQVYFPQSLSPFLSLALPPTLHLSLSLSLSLYPQTHTQKLSFYTMCLLFLSPLTLCLSLSLSYSICLSLSLSHTFTNTFSHPSLQQIFIDFFLQVVNYGVSGHYNAHHDTSRLNPQVPCCTRSRTQACRICRLVIHLRITLNIHMNGLIKGKTGNGVAMMLMKHKVKHKEAKYLCD